MRLTTANDFRQTSSSPGRNQRRAPPRSRSNTAHSYHERYAHDEPVQEPEPVRPSIRSGARVPSSSRGPSSSTRLDTHLERANTHDDYHVESPQAYKPVVSRSSTFQGPTSIYRESPISAATSRQNSNYSDVGSLRGSLRPPPQRINTNGDVFGDPSDDSTLNSASPDRSYGARSVSPATSHGSVASRSAMNANAGNSRKGPPPPPPSRAKKPPPPPPMKRADMSTTSLNRY